MFPVLALLTIGGLVTLTSQRPGVLDEISMLEATNSSLLRYPTDASFFGISVAARPSSTICSLPKISCRSQSTHTMIVRFGACFSVSPADWTGAVDWRDVPLLTALSFGVASVEADVWLVGDTLYVGHEMAALTPDRTLDSLYIQPLLSIIEGQNPKSQFTVNQTSINGVYDTSSSTPLQVLVDMKTDGQMTLPFVLKALQPLRERGYLTTCVSNGTCTLGPIVVVGTGNTPLAGIQALSPRDVFFDAPLIELNSTFDITISPIASTDYQVAVGWSGIGNINQTQLAAIQKYVGDAHALGLRARFWDTPGWPIHARNNVWQTLMDNGADWLNADDLEAAATIF